jgi:hypothetical protein
MTVKPNPSDSFNMKWGAGRIYPTGRRGYSGTEPPICWRRKEVAMFGVWVITSMILIRLVLPLAAMLAISGLLRRLLA